MRNSFLAFSSLLILGTALPALAHGLRVEYQLMPEAPPTLTTNVERVDVPGVQIQAKFESGEPIAHARVEIYAPNQAEQPWLTGQADGRGHFTFNPDTVGEWFKVHQAGHGAVVKVPIDRLPSPVAPPSATDDATATLSQPSPAIRVAQPQTGGGLPPMQREIGSVLVIGGCIGTALYFRSRKH